MCCVYDVMVSNLFRPWCVVRLHVFVSIFVACLLIFATHDYVHCLQAGFIFTFQHLMVCRV
jgi:hypothetical protein